MFPDAKVYHDGSHFIAIPKSTVKRKPKAVKKPEEKDYFITDNLARIRKNLNSKKNRAWRKARLAEFNSFCTFTYDDNKVSEDEFRKKLKRLLANLNYRKKWTYMGIWGRGGKTNKFLT